MFDGELPGVEVPYAPESTVVTEELNDIAVARPGVVGERFDVTAGERAQPGPGSSESVGEAGDCGLYGEVPAKQRGGERVKK